MNPVPTPAGGTSTGNSGSGASPKPEGGSFRKNANNMATKAFARMPSSMRNGIAKGTAAAGRFTRSVETKITQGARTLYKGATSIVAFVTSPVGLISVVLVIMIMLTLTLQATYGSSGVQCPGDGQNAIPVAATGGGGGGGDAPWNDNAKAVAKAFQKAGYSKGATAAALGNFKQESNFNPTALSSKGAYGFAQWLGGRLTAMRAYATSKGKPDSDIGVQAEFAAEVEAGPNGGWGLGYAGVIKSKYPDVDTSSTQGLWRAWASTKSDEESVAKGAFLWMAGWERPGMTEAAENTRENAAKAYLKKLDDIGGTWAEDGSVPDVGGGDTSGGPSSPTEFGAVIQAQCLLRNNAGAAITGQVGDFPRGKGDYSWMGDAGVHSNGDYGALGNISGDYQCVWYAWTRLYMIHGHNPAVLSPYAGNGGAIWRHLKGQPGWEVDQTPHPGDGISSVNPPLASGNSGAGHVAVVEMVEDDPSGWKVTLSEGNHRGNGGFDGYYGGRTLTAAQLAGTDTYFFRNTAWASK